MGKYVAALLLTPDDLDELEHRPAGVGRLVSAQRVAAIINANEPDDRVYILDASARRGNSALFWRAEGAGYTCDLDDAGLYAPDDSRIGCRETDVAVTQELAEKHVQRHVRLDHLRIDIEMPRR